MKKIPIKIRELAIDSEKPWDGDKLERQKCAALLTDLLENQIAPLTVSINGEWGSGKTFMLKRWQRQLEKDGYSAIYFNAWEDDFIADPLVAILGQFKSILVGEKAEAVKRKLKVAYRFLSNATLRFVTAGCADPEDLKPEENVIARYTALKKDQESLKKALAAFIAQLPEKKPLVFIIDELDRCRPTFAIEVLERIKHLFDIDHLIFVLGIDRNQLGKSIQAVYGNIDIENYLHRFIDLDFLLPKAQKKEFFTAIWDRYGITEHLAEMAESEKNDFNKGEGNAFKTLFADVLEWHNFSLREIEQCIKLYAMILRSSPITHFTWPQLIPVLLVLKLKNNSLYQKYINRQCTVTEVLDFILPQIRTEHSWACTVVTTIVYSTFVSDHPKTDQEKAISKIISFANENKSIKEMPFVSRYLSQCSTEEIARFASILESIRHTFGGSSEYNPGALKSLVRKMDLILTGVQDDFNR
jgi:hypothetical protein